MDFTIITPNLNYGRFLADCLSSVAGQTGVTLEHLVFDGGSTDESQEVAARFPEVEWSQGKDSGMSAAINKGFDKARGDWVIWLNADDRLKPGALAEMLIRLRQSKADLVYGDYDFIDRNGGWLRTMKVPRWSRFAHIYHHCYVPSTAAFYRNSTVIGKGHRLREDFRYVMDGEFYARLDSIGMKFEHVPVNVADFRLHDANASHRHLARTKDMDMILEAERQHVESRAIRRAYGITIFRDPYHIGLIDGVLSVLSRSWKAILKLI
ncbi:MAG: glycosyltransferase family 2 protein [Luteolibacter sp.]|uniref:glycosyltransferase family 2 protein n=1 Tax=Luteolibacter sp. TaxID=1962973 RepID=UPI003266B503